jgi:hypothetical protein
MYLPYDLGAFLLMTAWVIPRSLPRLRKKNPVPIELQLRPLRDMELTEKQRSFFSLFDQKLESLGYHCFCTYTATNTGGKGLSRNYVNPSDPANCTVVLVEIETVVQGVKHFGQSSSVQFLTKFPEGRRCATTNSGALRLFDAPPGWRTQRCRNVTDLAELKRRHDRLASDMGVPLPPIGDEAALFESTRMRHRTYFDHQVRNGLYAPDPDGTWLRPTDRFHWRAIRQHYNPLIHPFRADSFLPAALLGAGLPLLASRSAELLSAVLDPYLTLPRDQLPMLIATMGVLLGGVGTGWFLKRQTILWTFLLIYVPLCLLGRTPPIPLFVYIAAILAYYVRQFRLRSRLMLIEDTRSSASPS